MATMPGILIKIGADTTDAIQGLNRVENAMGRSLTGAEKMDRVFGAMRVAMIGAAAAAGAFAVKLGVDAVQGAIEDEKALASLNQTLGNLGFGGATTEVDRFVGSLQTTFGVSDSLLRPAFDRLIRSTRDVGEAERALAIAMDVSAGTGKDLEAVTAAIGKAYEGNTGALAKLGTGLDASIIKSGDMQAITKGLADTFSGQAATAANTFQGRLNIVSEAAAEASEQVGYSLLNAMTNITDAMGGSGGAAEAIATTGDEIATIIDLTSDAVTEILKLIKVTDILTQSQLDANAAGEGANGWVEYLISRVPLVGGAYVELLNGRQREAAQSLLNQGIIGAEAQRYIGLANAAKATANAILQANAARANQAVADRYTALAVQQYGETIRFAGGNLSTYFNQVTAVNTALGGGGGGGSTASALDKVNPKLQKLIDLTRGHIEQLTGSDGYVSNLAKLTDQMNGYSESVASNILGGISLSKVFDEADISGSLTAFTAQIGDVATFSTGLANLAAGLPNSPGAKALLAQLQTLGAGQGNAVLAGLTTEMATGLASQLDAAITTVNGNASLLGNKFYGEGVAGAQQLVIGMAEQISKDEAALIALGGKIGQPIGAQIKAEIVAALNEALGQAAATQAAAVASTIAQVAASITGDTYNISGVVIDPVNVGRTLDRINAQAKSRTGG
jgi:hypothetical protein